MLCLSGFELYSRWVPLRASILETVPAIRDSNMLKLVEFVHYEAKSFFRIAWHLRTNIKCLAEVSMNMFLDILCTCLWWLTQYVTQMKDIEITLYSKVYFKPEPGNVWNRWRFLKKLFMFLEELNRRIRENGWNFGLPWICIFKNISPLPSHFTFFLDFSHLFSDSDNFFRDPWVPFTFFRAATFAVNNFPIKIREQNIVLTQHSAKAHTNPLSKKRKRSHARGTHATSTICKICWERCYFLLWVFLIRFDLECSCAVVGLFLQQSFLLRLL